MRRLCDIEKISKTVRVLNKEFGKGTFTRKEFERVSNNYKTLCLQTLIHKGFVKVDSVEYFDVPNTEEAVAFYATKGDLMIKVRNDIHQDIFASYGFQRLTKKEKAKGKRNFYVVDYDKMEQVFYKSKELYLKYQIDAVEELQEKLDKRKARLVKIANELTFNM